MKPKNITVGICQAINCPFKDSNGNVGCARYSVSAMCHLNELFDFRNIYGEKWYNNSYWLFGANPTDEELDLLKSEK